MKEYAKVVEQKNSGIKGVIDWDSMDDKDVVHEVKERYYAARDSNVNQNKREKWIEAYEHFMADYNTTKNIKTPTLFTLLQNLLSRMWRLIFHEEEFITVEPDSPEVTGEQAKKVQTMFLHQFKMINYIDRFVRVLMNNLVYGTCVIKVGYNEQKKKEWSRWMETSEDGTRKSRSGWQDSTIKYPYFDNVDLFDFYPDPDAKSPEFASYYVEKQRKRLSQLLNYGDEYMNTDAIIEMNESGKLKKPSASKIDEIKAKSGNSKDSETPEDQNTYKDELDPLIELWIYTEDDRLIVIAAESIVIRNEPNPYAIKKKPYVIAQNYPDFSQFFGIGDAEMGVKIQEYLDAMLQKSFEYSKIATSHKLLKRRNSYVDEAALTDEDSSIVDVDDLDAVEQLKMSTANMAGAQHLVEYFRFLLEDMTSMTDYMKGAPVKSETAAGVYAIQEAGNTKFLFKVDMFEPFLQELAEWYRWLNYQYMDDTEDIKVTANTPDGFEWGDITPDDLGGKFTYKFKGSANAESDDIRFMKYLKLMQAVFPYVDQDEFIRRLLETANVDNIDKLMKAMPQQQPGQPQDQQGQPDANVPPEEDVRRMMSEANNPLNSMNGGPK